MKKIVILIIVLFFGGILCGQESMTFQIEKLEKPEKLLKTVPAELLFSKYEKNLLDLSVTKPLVDKGPHALLAGFLQAYQEHRPVVLSPDMIWLLVCQGFALHVNNNAQQLRGQLVGFEGQKELSVVREVPDGNMADFPWETVFPEFAKQINDQVGKGLTKVLTADFTTSTPASVIASQITVMESVKKYFKYKVIMIGCGIPEVTIEGSLRDWENILRRLDQLAVYDLKWWTDEMKPVIKKIIATKKGQSDKTFWMNMVRCHKTGVYGNPSDIDGWLVKFFPYESDKVRANLKTINNLDRVPDEIVRVPFVFIDDITKKSYQMEFWAGFLGLSQDEKTMALKPEIGWAVNQLD